MYNAIDYILTVSNADKRMFESYALTHPVLDTVGDTRYDQVWQRSADSKTRHIIPAQILAGKNIVVIGSSWQEDEERLLPALFRLLRQEPRTLIIMVPHEPHLETLERIEGELNGHANHIRFSDLADYDNETFIIIDSVGILMTLYQYAHVAYVGGSFQQGVHNVLEPASYGIPIILGPKHHNSREAEELIVQGAAFVGEESESLYLHLTSLFTDEPKRLTAGRKALDLVRQNIGATERFLSYLEKVL